MKSPRKRRVLNKLYEELSLSNVSDKEWNKYHLWVDLALLGYDPEFLTTAQASDYCEANGHTKVARKIRKYNPDLDTPEEIMERMVSG
jgi:hypothetical protein